MSRKWLQLTAVVLVVGAGLGIYFGFFPADQRGFELPRDLTVQAVVWEPGGASLLVLCHDESGKGVVELRSLDGRLHWRLDGFRIPLAWRLASFSPDGGTLALGSAEGLHIVDVEKGAEVARLSVNGDIGWLGYLSDGRLATIVVEDDVLYFELRSADGTLLSREEISPAGEPAFQLTDRLDLSPDGRFLLFPGGESDHWSGFHVVNLVDLETGEARSWDLRELSPTAVGAITGLALRPDGEEVAIALGIYEVGRPFLLRLDVTSGVLREIPPPEVPVRALPWFSGLAYSPDGDLLAVAPGYQMVCLVGAGGTWILRMGWTKALAFSPDGSELAFGSGREIGILEIEGDWKPGPEGGAI